MPPEFVIDDATASHHLTTGHRGLDLSLRPRGGVAAYAGSADPFPAALLVPKSEWQARIAEMEERKSRLSDLVNQAGLPCKNQEQTSYCWVNAGTHCVEIARTLQNQKTVILSPASAGAQIKNYQNVGGWGKEALDFIAEHGLAPVDLWPANAIDRRYCTDAAKSAALRFRQSEWWVLEPQNMEQLVSCLLRRVPVSAGFSWWSHQVTLCDPVWKDGDIAIRIRNSWGMDWPEQGAGGYSLLQGRRMYPDDACAPRVALAS